MSRWLVWRTTYLDRIIALALLVVLAPVLGAIGLMVLAADGRPITVRLRRVGRHSVSIEVTKFRTMRQRPGTTRADGSVLTAADDPRVTRLGRSLRRLRLDELPQLWDVVRGDMALLGPRPETPEYVTNAAAWEAVLQTVPGIAGPTQVYASRWEANLPPAADGDRVYREQILPAKLAIDAWYVTSATPLVDLDVAIGVLSMVVLGRPPRRLHRRVARASATADPVGY